MNTLPTLLFYLFYMLSVIISYRIKWKKINWFAVVSFTLLLGLRGNGIDYHGYSDQFDYLYSLNYGLFDENFFNAEYLYSKQNFEFGYLIVLKLCKLFSLNNIFFFSSIAFAQMFFLDKFIRRFDDNRIKQFLVFFFFTTLMFVESFNVMRQLLAILIFINLIEYIEKRDLKRYLIYCGLLYFIHSSSFILIPLYFIINKDYLEKPLLQLLVYLCAVIFANIFINKILQSFDYLYAILAGIDMRAVGYLNTESEVTMSTDFQTTKYTTEIFRLFTVCFFIYNSKLYKLQYGVWGTVLYNLTFIGFIIQEFIFGISLQRLNYYFYYCSFAVLSLMCFMNIVEHKNGKFGIAFSYSVMLLYLLWFINSVFQGAAECAPYEFSKLL